VWREFWAGECASMEKLLKLCSLPKVQHFVHQMDIHFFQVLVEILIPDVLRTVLSSPLSCQIRNFARNMEQWMRRALETVEDFPQAMRDTKLASVKLFSNALTRYTSFNHLARAADSVLNNKEQIAQMYNDFCKYGSTRSFIRTKHTLILGSTSP